MAEDQGEKTEEATDTRREDFRKRGQVAMTRELSTALFFLLMSVLLYVMGRFFMQNLFDVFHQAMGGEFIEKLREGHLREIMLSVGFKVMILVGPLFFIALVVGIAAQVLQTGFLQVEDALTPNLEKLNPLTSLGRIFSMKGVVEILKSIIKMSAIGFILYLVLKGEIRQIPYLSAMSIEQIMGYLGEVVYKLILSTGLFMLVLAVADYFFQRWQLEKEMMMTKQEIKEEMKSRDGDPLIKARIRRVQKEIANRKMMTEIPKGDVVITNPTHIAVVIKYSADLPAPQLIAKGADFMAEKIKEIAREHNIPIVENKPLARTIFKTMKVGQVIPRELFVAVAEVLSYIYRLKRRKRRSSTSSNQSANRPSQAERGL